MNEHPNLEIRPSPVHGMGLFATGLIKQGELIGVINGNPIRVEGCYILWDEYGSAISIEGPLKYINHSFEPNAEFTDNRVVAIRDICADEEITHDYGINHIKELKHGTE